ncbi:MAG: bifunctional hydroxymethylpyrimidine kinase/phosphomethylpyrimidine kinase, partial [Planctomycetota bacterium]
GGYEAGSEVARAYREALAPRAAVFTPNIPELAAVLDGAPISSLFAAGCGAVLHKGGHGEGAEIVDRLLMPTAERSFVHERLSVGPVHGTGCALATAIAAGLANGLDVARASERAIAWLQRCLRALPPRASSDLGEDAPRPRPLGIVFAARDGLLGPSS